MKTTGFTTTTQLKYLTAAGIDPTTLGKRSDIMRLIATGLLSAKKTKTTEVRMFTERRQFAAETRS